MPVSYYRSTLTTALKDNENRNTLSKTRWLLSMSCAPRPDGAGLVFKPSGAPDSLRTQVHILAALTQSFIPLQRINWIPGYLLCQCLSDEPLKPRGSLWLLRMLEFSLSCCPCPGFQNLAWSQMSRTHLWRKTFIWAFLFSAPAVSLLPWHDLLLSPLSFPVH